jgi:hypothetical protein
MMTCARDRKDAGGSRPGSRAVLDPTLTQVIGAILKRGSEMKRTKVWVLQAMLILAGSSAASLGRAAQDCKWPTGANIPVYVNRAIFEQYGIKGEFIRDITMNAADEWFIRGGADFSFSFAGFTTATLAPANSILIAAESYFAGQPERLAGTYGPICSSPKIVVYVEHFMWSLSDSRPDAASYSLYHVMLHELGHALGVGHSSNPKAVMAPSTSDSRRTLQDDDIDALRNRTYPYPVRTGTKVKIGRSSNNGATWTFPGGLVDPNLTTNLAPAIFYSGATYGIAWVDTNQG